MEIEEQEEKEEKTWNILKYLQIYPEIYTMRQLQKMLTNRWFLQPDLRQSKTKWNWMYQQENLRKYFLKYPFQ